MLEAKKLKDSSDESKRIALGHLSSVGRSGVWTALVGGSGHRCHMYIHTNVHIHMYIYIYIYIYTHRTHMYICSLSIYIYNNQKYYTDMYIMQTEILYIIYIYIYVCTTGPEACTERRDTVRVCH